MLKRKKYIPALRFECLTIFYDRIISVFMPESKFRSQLIKYVLWDSPNRIMEVGHGTGKNILELKRVTPEINIQGLEVDVVINEIAKKRLKGYRNVELLTYGGNNFPFESNSFDVIYNSLVFHHLELDDKEFVLKEILRTLKEGGKMILLDWGKPTHWYQEFFFWFIRLLDGFSNTKDNHENNLPCLMTQAGFKNVKELYKISGAVGTLYFYSGVKEESGSDK